MRSPTPAQFTAYQQAFDYFDQTLFEKSLPDCMLSYSLRRHSSHTLFTSEQWQEVAGSATSEISLNLKQLSKEQPIEVMATMVREMVHLWQEKYGHPSTTGYYNREWAEKMEKVGLIPSATRLPGGKRVGKGIQQFIEPKCPFERAFRKMPPSCLWRFDRRYLQVKKVKDIPRRCCIGVSAEGQKSGANAGWSYYADAAMFLPVKRERQNRGWMKRSIEF
jgi:hypothetical protein